MGLGLNDLSKDLIAGTIGGAAGIIVGHPADTVKVRLQTNIEYLGIGDCMRKTLSKEGPTAFFKGVTAPVLAAAPINAIIFMIYGGSIRLSSDYCRLKTGEALALRYHFLCGTLAGFSQCVFGCPNEHIKIKCQVSVERGIKSIPMATQMITKAGPASLFQGFWLTTLRDTPAFGIYFATYEWFRKWLRHGPMQLGDVASAFWAGGVAGASSFFFLHPVDVIKSMRQEQSLFTKGPDTRTINLCIQAYKQGGVPFFFRGIIPSVIRAYPVSAVTFVVYDSIINSDLL